jgi:Uma2 family endonuclease
METSRVVALSPAQDWLDGVEDTPRPFDGMWRYDREFVGGVAVEGEVIGLAHQTAIFELQRQLVPELAIHGGFAWADGGLVISRDEVRNPDLAVWLDRVPRQRGARMLDVPDLCIEVMSHRREDVARDRLEKPVAYTRVGVQWYWLVEPVNQVVEVFALQERGTPRVAFEQHGLVHLPPGFPIDLDALWSVVARTRV